MRLYISARSRLGFALVGSSLVSVFLFLSSVHTTRSDAFVYLNWNLFLAWIPLLLTLWLSRVLHRKLWSSWEALLVTVVWLSFLPNSFYMISDYVHIQQVSQATVLFDVVMFSSFILNGVVLGYLSLFLVHQELLQRVSKRMSASLIGVVLLLCSFAIYLGHDLRWNTWDVLSNPGGILVDVTNHFVDPSAHDAAYTTTFSFFVLLSSLYIVIWYIARNMRQQKA
jgi:uncharacterized membrane protein